MVWDDHENHQQHQQNVNQWNYIYIRNNPTFTAKSKAHGSPRRKRMTLREDPHIEREKTANGLLPGLELRGDEADLVDSRAVHNIDRTGYFHEQNIIIALHERYFFGAILEDRFHAGPHGIPCGVLIVDLQVAVHLHLDDNGLIFKFRVLLL